MRIKSDRKKTEGRRMKSFKKNSIYNLSHIKQITRKRRRTTYDR
jgi:hypothetical protein